MGMTNKLDIHFSSKSDEWATPQELFDRLSAKYGPFDLDAAANHDNQKVGRYCTPDGTFLAHMSGPFQLYGSDGLSTNWCAYKKVWVNPPYSRGQQGLFIKKAYEESQKGCTVVALLPARTDTRAFHTYIWDLDRNAPREGVEIDFLKGRVKFEDPEAKCANPAPFPSMVVIFWGKTGA